MGMYIWGKKYTGYCKKPIFLWVIKPYNLYPCKIIGGTVNRWLGSKKETYPTKTSSF